jgi:FkbM family methyltransferase
MGNKSVTILNFIGYRILNLSTIFINAALRRDNVHQMPPKEWKRFKTEDPYDMKRVTYPLNEKSFVIDAGSFTGDWSQRIFCMYQPFIAAFEPHPDLAEAASRNFQGNKKVIINQFGLGGQTQNVDFYGKNMNASVFRYSHGNKAKVRVHIEKASDYFNEHYKNKFIDLLKINIEGSEYEMLMDLLDNFDMTKINHIQVQFHTNYPMYDNYRQLIRLGLSKTHKMDWNYDYVFESWSLKEK